MCNPRRVEVTATRQLVDAWEHEIARLARLSATATGEARVREPLDDSVGAPTLAALVSALDASEEWVYVDGSYRRELQGGYAAYHPDSQELEIVARLSMTVEVQGEARETVHGTVDETIEAAGEGRYYDDEWDGVTEADAREAAERAAEANLDAAAHSALDARIAEAERDHDDRLTAAARAEADLALTRAVAERSAMLSTAARDRLVAIGIQGRTLFYRVLAEAYREAILSYARDRGAEGVSWTNRDGILEIQFEMQA
jgi:hypothetical protein